MTADETRMKIPLKDAVKIPEKYYHNTKWTAALRQSINFTLLNSADKRIMYGK